MQRVPYFICSDGEDVLFSEEPCERYVELMRAKGHEVAYRAQSGLLHGDFRPEERGELHEFLVEKIEAKRACLKEKICPAKKIANNYLQQGEK